MYMLLYLSIAYLYLFINFIDFIIDYKIIDYNFIIDFIDL